MLVYINCVLGETEYTVALNPEHVVSIIEIKPNDTVQHTALITVSTGREYFTNENYLELVSKVSVAA